MDNKKVFGFMVGVFGISVLALAVKVIVFPNKDKMINYLMSVNPTWNREVVFTWDYGFVRSLYNSTKNGDTQFEYKGKSYNTKTAMAV